VRPGLARGLLLAAGAGLLTAAPFFPFGVSFLVLASLTPLLAATRGATVRRAALYGFAAGFVGCGVAFHWIVPLIAFWTKLQEPIPVLGFLGWLVGESALWALIGAAWSLAGATRAPGIVCVAAPVVLESVWPRVFPWNFGAPLVEIPVLAQIGDLGGIHAATFLVLVANLTLFELVRFLRARHGAFPLRTVGAGALLVAATVIYGAVRLRDLPEPAATLTVGLVHPAIPLAEKHRALRDLGVWREVKKKLVARAREGITAEGPVDLVVIPEAMMYLAGGRERFEWGREQANLAREVGTPVLFGASVIVFDSDRQYNSALLDDGENIQSYEKHCLLPFGESVPLGRQFPWLERWIGHGSLAAGPGPKLLALGGRRLAPLVCYEAILPGYVRQFIDRGGEILINVTEDGWYTWPEQYQHLLLARFRAIENRCFLARCVNNGISAVVDPCGRVVASRGDGESPGFIRARAGLCAHRTWYTRSGNWLAIVLACVLVLIGAHAVGARWRGGRARTDSLDWHGSCRKKS
jgi:apolipoprotein N-acyltransferase